MFSRDDILVKIFVGIKEMGSVLVRVGYMVF